MPFIVDARIEESSQPLFAGPLSQVYIKNDQRFPWLILVPRVENIQEIYQLNREQGNLLMNEITAVSRIVDDYFKPDKLNVGALGNIVNQLHVHIIARFKQDKLWPQGVWQEAVSKDVLPWQEGVLSELITDLSQALRLSFTQGLDRPSA